MRERERNRGRESRINIKKIPRPNRDIRQTKLIRRECGQTEVEPEKKKDMS